MNDIDALLENAFTDWVRTRLARLTKINQAVDDEKFNTADLLDKSQVYKGKDRLEPTQFQALANEHPSIQDFASQIVKEGPGFVKQFLGDLDTPTILRDRVSAAVATPPPFSTVANEIKSRGLDSVNRLVRNMPVQTPQARPYATGREVRGDAARAFRRALGSYVDANTGLWVSKANSIEIPPDVDPNHPAIPILTNSLIQDVTNIILEGYDPASTQPSHKPLTDLSTVLDDAVSQRYTGLAMGERLPPDQEAALHDKESSVPTAVRHHAARKNLANAGKDVSYAIDSIIKEARDPESIARKAASDKAYLANLNAKAIKYSRRPIGGVTVPRQGARADAISDLARTVAIDDHFASEGHRSGKCGPVCTFGDW